MQLLQDIETAALKVREAAPEGEFMALESPQTAIDLPMERPLFTPPLKPELDLTVEGGDETDVDPEALFQQVLVDKARLQAAISRSLQGREQVTLAQVIADHPLKVGLAELVTYLSLGGADRRASFAEGQSDRIEWRDQDGITRRARVPRLIFTRQG